MVGMGYRSRVLLVVRAVRSHGGRITLIDRVRATPAMIVDVMTGRWTGVGRGRIVLSLLGLAYVISPLDFIPELLLGPFGIADDITMAAVAVASLFNAAEQYVSDQVSAAPDGEVITGVVLDRK